MNAWALDVWRLPSMVSFLEAIERGLAVTPVLTLRAGPSMPDGLVPALTAFLLDRGRQVMATESEASWQPARLLGDLLGLEPELDALVQDGFDHVAFVDARKLPASGEPGSLDAWGVFLGRLTAARGTRPFGLAALFLLGEKAPAVSCGPTITWGGRLRRTDIAIWSEVNAPLDRREPLSALATALATEFCGWRLDLVVDLARARDEDLFDPLAWLEGRADDAYDDRDDCMMNGVAMPCPVRLLRQGRREELERRVWRAQLGALFPWLEECRQELVARHRDRLSLDPRRSRFGEDVEDLDIGPIAFQLESRVGRDGAARLHALRRIRNRLAHGVPADRTDLSMAIGSPLP